MDNDWNKDDIVQRAIDAANAESARRLQEQAAASPEAPERTGVVVAENLHLIAHVARMMKALFVNAEHPRRQEYEQQIADYRQRWADLPHDDRTEIAEQAVHLHDLDETTVGAAVQVLNG